MLVTQLDVVNRCLASMGEAPINSLATNNAIVTSAINAFNTALLSEQGRGWWFNTESIKLVPTTDQEYFVPSDVLGLTADTNPPWLSIRARKLYDNRNGTKFEGTQDVKVQVIRLVPFEDLPYHAQAMIRDAAVLLFQSDFDGDQEKMANADRAFQNSFILCRSEHIRAVRANMLYQGGVGQSIVGTRFHNTANNLWR